jgi:serine/threonine protein kinase
MQNRTLRPYLAVIHRILIPIVVAMRRGAQVALNVASGLHFLHSNRVVHMDIKSPNILLARNGHAKIADVGMARFTKTQGCISSFDTRVGGPCWLPQACCSDPCLELRV